MKKKLVSVVIVSKDRKKDLIECLDAFLKQSYKPIEIIVVDNNSSPPVKIWLKKKYKKVKLISLTSNVGAAEGRNIGLRESKGDYVLFSDDDAYPDDNMVKYLVEAFEKKKSAGIIQPLIYDKQKKNLLQGAGHDINITTSRIRAWGVREEDVGQYEGLREIPMCGCVWMVKREVFGKIGEYDEEYFIPYEDSDFSIRALRAGFKNYCYSKAKSWHQGKKTTFVHPWLEWLGITSAERAYRVARNKMIFMRKHSPLPNILLFFFVLLPIYVVIQSVIILSTGRFDILLKYWQGVFSGLWYSITFFLKNSQITSGLNKVIESVSLFLMAWTEPECWLVDRSAKTILDVGCGQGLPMRLIKMRMSFDKIVGVDLFKPYIKEAKKEKIHDKYVISDIRKLPFKDNSFDVVIALQVLEHLPKRTAWKVLKKMEKIAKKQVIVATPIGEMYHPEVDNNPLQAHKSSFLVSDFQKRGYKVIKMGRASILGDHGIVHSIKSSLLKRFVFLINILLTPLFYIIQPLSDYHLYAVKNFDDHKNVKLNEPLLKFHLFPFLLALYPVLFLFSFNRSQLSASVLIFPLIVVFISVLTLYLFLSIFFKDNKKSALITAIFFIMFFSYSNVINQAKTLAGHSIIRSFIWPRFTLPMWTLIFLLATYLVLKTKKDLKKLVGTMNFLAIVLFLIPIVSLVKYGLTKGKYQSTSTINVDNKQTLQDKKNLPDIYYIIPDSYANSSILQKDYGYDNSDFENSLKSKGFYIASKSFANYPYTFLSVASSLNMKYLNYLTNIVGENSKSEEIANDLITNNEVTKYLKTRGYRYIHLSSGWGPTNYNNNADVNLQAGFANEFTAVLLRSTVLSPFEFTKPFLRRKTLHILKSLEDVVDEESPKFVFSHNLLAHPPWIFSENGGKVANSETEYEGVDVWDQRDLYLGQLSYANKRILNIVDLIIKNSENPPIIIIHSDTGPGTTFNHTQDEDIRKKMKIFMAIYLPNGYDDLYENISPVNVLRVVFDDYLGGEFELLEDKSYFSHYETPYIFEDVTDKL